MAGYSQTPLVKKLGIKESSRCIVLHLPKQLSALFSFDTGIFETDLTGSFDYIHLFSQSEKELSLDFAHVKKFLTLSGMLWVSWPKSGKLGTDLTENTIRDMGLELGLVDTKVAAIDETWSGLKFVYRTKDRLI